jgi:L-ribulose-5-phosphate 4-epimerase
VRSPDLREEVLAANLALPAHGLVKLTWGNVSGVDRDAGVMAIKPSGVPYEGMAASDVVLVDLESGEVVDGERRPSSDTPTHLALYRALDGVGGIVHTHSTYATAWAQAGREIPLLGTTHADFSAEAVPVTRQLTEEEVTRAYEAETGTVILETVSGRAAEVPAVLVRGHAPFCWGASPAKAVEAAVTLEEVARLALLTGLLAPDGALLDTWIRDKHHERKHGPAAYYGQG